MEPRSGGRYAGAPGAAAPPSGSEATDKGSVAEAAAEDAAVTVAAAAMRGEARHRQVQRYQRDSQNRSPRLTTPIPHPRSVRECLFALWAGMPSY